MTRKNSARIVLLVLSSLMLASCGTGAGTGSSSGFTVQAGLTSDQYYKQANAYLADGKKEEAVAYFKAAVQAAEDANRKVPAANYLSALGAAYTDLGKLSEAEDSFTRLEAISKATSLPPDTRAKYYMGLGELNVKKGDHAAARDNFKKAIAVGKSEVLASGRVHKDLFETYVSLGDLPQAKKLLQERQARFRKDPTLPTSMLTLAQRLLEKGQSAEAVSLYESALAVAKEQKDIASQVAIYQGMSKALVAEKRFADATNSLKLAAELQRSYGEPKARLKSLADLAAVHINAKDYDKAQQALIDCLQVMHKTGNNTPLKTKWVYGRLCDLGAMYAQANQQDKAEKLLATTLRLAEEHNDLKANGVAPAIYRAFADLGVNCTRAKQYDRAEDALASSLTVMDKAGAADKEQAAIVYTLLTNVGAAYAQDKQFDKAESVLNHCAQLAEHGGDLKSAAPTICSKLTDVAAKSLQERQLDKAERALLTCLSITEKAGVDQEQAKAAYTLLADVGGAYVQSNQYDRAEGVLSKCAEFAQRQGDLKSSLAQPIYRRLGDLGAKYLQAKRYEKAHAAFANALAVMQKAGDADKAQAAVMHNFQALAYIEEKRFNEADKELSTAVEIAAKADPGSLTSYKKTLTFIRKQNSNEGEWDRLRLQAEAALSQKQYDKAMVAMDNCLAVLEKTGFQKDRALWAATVLSDLGSKYSLSKQYDKAEKALEQSIGVLERGGGLERAQGAETYNQLAFVHINLAKLDAAQSELAKAVNIATKTDRAALPRYKSSLAYIKAQSSGETAWHRLTFEGDRAGAQKQFDKAAQYYNRALETAVAANNNLLIAKSARALAELEKRKGAKEAAANFLVRSIAAREKAGAFDLDTAIIERELAWVQIEQGKSREALDNLQKSTRIAEKIQAAPGKELVFNNTLDMARTEAANKHPTEARAQLSKAMKLAEGLSGKEGKHMAEALAVALSLNSQGADQQEALLRKSIAMSKKTNSNPTLLAGMSERLASILSNKRDYAGAEPLYQEAIKLKQAKSGSNSSDLISPLTGLSFALKEQKKHEAAIAAMERLAKLREQFGQSAKSDHTFYGDLAASYKATGKYANADQAIRKAMSLAQGNNSAIAWYKQQHIDILMALKESERKAGDQQSAEKHLAQAIELMRERKSDAVLVLSLEQSALMHLSQKKHELAENELKEALGLLDRMQRSESAQAAGLHNLLGKLYAEKNQVSQADEHLRKAVAIAQKSDPKAAAAYKETIGFYGWEARWKRLKYEGDKAIAQRRYQDAINLYKEAIEAAQAHNDSAKIVETARGLAFAYRSKSRYKQAEEMYALAISEQEKTGRFSEYTANDYREIAWFQSSQGKKAEAEASLAKSTQLAKKYSASKPAKEILFHNLIDAARADIEKKRYKEAEQSLMQASSLAVSLGGREGPEICETLSARAAMEVSKKAYKNAETALRKSLEIKKKNAKNPIEWAGINQELAAVLVQQRKYAEAEKLLREALKNTEASLGKNNIAVIYPLGGLAYTLRAQQKFDEAAALHMRRIELQEKHPSEHMVPMHTLYGDLTEIYRSQRRYDQAEKYLHKAMTSLKEEDKDNLLALANYKEILAAIYLATNHRKDTVPIWSSIVTLRETALGKTNPATLESMRQLAFLYKEFGRAGEADKLMEEVKKRRMQ